jgi:hypothetical protein
MEPDMENEETKDTTPQSKLDQKENTLENLASELEAIKDSLKKRRSEITTLKILLYTGLAVLLGGFIYTNQTLQRAQYQNSESNINYLQSQVNNTLLLLERQLHLEMQEIEEKFNSVTTPDFHQSIQRMNQVLDQIEPRSPTMEVLMEKVQTDSIELKQMVDAIQLQEGITQAH